MERVKKLTVKYNGAVVGYLAEVEDGKIGFQYDENWTANGFSLSPFSLPLSREIYYGGKPAFCGLYGVFVDSLPDGWGELLIKRMLAKKGINYEKLSPLTRLALINDNGLGGLSYEPTLAEKTGTDTVDLDTLSADVQKIFDDEEQADTDWDTVYALGGSSGGARPKAHVRIDGEEWIVKFPCRMDPPDIGAQEYIANLRAQECGIKINECRIFASKECSGYFGAKRFDRKNGKRIHVISLSALLETTHRIPNLDYMHYFQVIQKICVRQSDLYEAFRRMVFNVLYQNKDDHGKNFAFLYDEALGGYTLSPAYDLTKTPRKAEHEMTVCGAPNPTETDLTKLAHAMKLSKGECEKIIATCRKVSDRE